MISAKVKVDVDDKAVDDFWNKLDAGLDDVADAILTNSQDRVSVNNGELKKSGHKESEFLDKSVVYDAPHAQYVEFGTDPHMPPLAPILKWVERKRADLGIKKGEVEKVAEAIRWKIFKHGTEPQPFLRPAFSDVEARAAEIIKRHFK